MLWEVELWYHCRREIKIVAAYSKMQAIEIADPKKMCADPHIRKLDVVKIPTIVTEYEFLYEGYGD